MEKIFNEKLEFTEEEKQFTHPKARKFCRKLIRKNP